MKTHPFQFIINIFKSFSKNILKNIKKKNSHTSPTNHNPTPITPPKTNDAESVLSKSSGVSPLPLLSKSQSSVATTPTPERIIDFLRTYAQAEKEGLLKENDLKQIKQNFMEEEKRFVKRLVSEKVQQQQRRKKEFELHFKQFEHELNYKYLAEQKLNKSQKNNKFQQLELQMWQIKEAAITSDEKARKLAEILKELK